jgi:hypothetical protein
MVLGQVLLRFLFHPLRPLLLLSQVIVGALLSVRFKSDEMLLERVFHMLLSR